MSIIDDVSLFSFCGSSSSWAWNMSEQSGSARSVASEDALKNSMSWCSTVRNFVLVIEILFCLVVNSKLCHQKVKRSYPLVTNFLQSNNHCMNSHVLTWTWVLHEILDSAGCCKSTSNAANIVTCSWCNHWAKLFPAHDIGKLVLSLGHPHSEDLNRNHWEV